MNKVKHFIRAVVFDLRARRAIRKAQRSANLHRRKFLVLVWNGRPRVVSMQGVKKLIRQHRFFKGFHRRDGTKGCHVRGCAAAIGQVPPLFFFFP